MWHVNLSVPIVLELPLASFKRSAEIDLNFAQETNK